MLKKLSIMGLLLFIVMAARMTCSAGELLQTTNFESGVSSPWILSRGAEDYAYSYVKDGKFVVHIDKKGTNKWDVQVRHRGLSIVAGYMYTVRFSMTATTNCKVYAKIVDAGEPYYEAWNNNWNPFSITANQVLTINQTFTANQTSKDAEFAFHLGGELAGMLPYEVQFISMSLNDNVPCIPTPTPTPARNIRVNQLGYYPYSVKKATLATNAKEPVLWKLKNSSGIVVASGTSQPFGFDHASGDEVQIIDFSGVTMLGKDYQLVAGDATSFPFDIGNDIYSNMKYDALKYFYHARSGIDIKLPYCVQSKWARPAGHPNDVAALKTGTDYAGPEKIDGTGGWYDGGDHGKYLVNGGLALWILQNQYEHSKLKGLDSVYGDTKLNIPESGNGINDLLDETRWEMEWMLKMQIPLGYEKAGMAAHKLADEKWTALATRPDQDKEKRIYYPPSTSATLNLAACTAQAARIWKGIDPAFADECLSAAETAWEAAKANPAVFAPYDLEMGSEAYGDDYVDDDFYWAACELYATTGKSEYLSSLRSYKECFEMPVSLTGEFKGLAGCFDRCSTGGLGTLTLALNKGDEFPEVKAGILKAADSFIETQKKEGYGVPLSEASYTDNLSSVTQEVYGYPNASNSYIVDKAIVMAYAYDCSNNSKYSDGMTEAIDYIMGRNPLIKSYVSGYGENPLKYPHHRFFCPQEDPSFPSVPPGFLSGGPNSGLEDPWVIGAGYSLNNTPAQKCYMDHVESWSTNEVNISWNAALAWVTYYIDAVNKVSVSPTPTTYYYAPGDINKDGGVNMTDVMFIARTFGKIKTDPDFDERCDLNMDGAINMMDVMKLALNFGYVSKE
ncbi:MAG: glycoside hydrolase family 9 protein [Bacillota bacterium]|nr:glycoside hydrolase family 9 protein [Bacillota bacterium]